ncbi:hypothetical protein ACL02U_11930 [Streptomyces sp. MS06]|uniref:hypothetical protein n=1 Tax=Streptomyces sp. MS06 TaxID=3385974 RepID=UPI0039A2558A
MTAPDRLIAALTAALTPHGPTTAAAIQDAATAARAVLGTDQCTHDRAVHTTHHEQPVAHCPWCTTPDTGDQT